MGKNAIFLVLGGSIGSLPTTYSNWKWNSIHWGNPPSFSFWSLSYQLIISRKSPNNTFNFNPYPCGSFKASGSRVKRFARSAVEEQGHRLSSPALRKAANCKNIKNAERDLHTLFRDLGLTLPVKISTKKCFGCGLVRFSQIPREAFFGLMVLSCEGVWPKLQPPKCPTMAIIRGLGWSTSTTLAWRHGFHCCYDAIHFCCWEDLICIPIMPNQDCYWKTFGQTIETPARTTRSTPNTQAR